VLTVRFENERLEKLEAQSQAMRAEVDDLRRQLTELRKILE
jgi:prefoldin subunit 5